MPPWMLAGIAAVLYAIAAIVRAINGGPGNNASTSHTKTLPSLKPIDSTVRTDDQEPDPGDSTVQGEPV